MDCGSTVLILLAFIQGTCGQTVTVTGPSGVEQGTNTVYECTLTGGSSSPSILWRDVSQDPNIIIFIGENREEFEAKHDNFAASVDGPTSTMTITNTVIEDEGIYRCTVGSAADEKSLSVEVESMRTLVVTDDPTDDMDIYVGTCTATGGKPSESITWILDGETLLDDDVYTIEEIPMTSQPPLSSTGSRIIFSATVGNYKQTLACNITGHDVIQLNGQITKVLDIHESPESAGTTVSIRWEPRDSGIEVYCDAENQPVPAMRNYYIYSNDTLLHDGSTASGNSVMVSDPVLGTEYTCIAGNYLGNTTMSDAAPYDPTRTTTPPPTTESITTGPTAEPTEDPTTPNVGAIVGGVVGGIALIIIVVLVIKFVVKPECMGGSGSNSGGSRKKPASSAVGSSNGSEKDKIKPSAAPRTQSSIQHTTDNPEQAEYAMVDRKPGGGGKGGGDMPDKGYGAGQNEPAGMVYADLDLSAKAGHTEKQIPQNKDDVVVYSSILV